MGVRDPVDQLHSGAAPAGQQLKCRLCTCGLSAEEGDNIEYRVCAACLDRPEARRLGIGVPPLAARRPHVPAPASAREFTIMEQSLIGKVHTYMPAAQLLEILNERLICDLGPDAARYSMEQLQQQIAKSAPARPAAGGAQDWASLRKLLARARKSGVLARITEQVIDDFAVVFSLNAKQVMVLKDTVLASQEARQ